MLTKKKTEENNLMPVKSYRNDLLVRLTNAEYSSQYLKVAFEATLEDGNMEAFLLALNNVIEAREGTSEVAKEANISKEELKRFLKEEESPNLMTLTSILKAVGLTIDFKPSASVNQD
jgi:probable addiction module antidote protein